MPTFSIAVNKKVLGTYVVKKSVISIGRSRTNTISIASKAVSRNHVRIELTRDGWSITDLGSLNGTYVNDIRVTSAFLSEGDKVTVGAYTISFSPEPLQDAAQEEHLAPVQTDAGEASDTDVRVEGAPPATDTALAPPKDIQAQGTEAQPPVEVQPRPAAVLQEITQPGPGQFSAYGETSNFQVADGQAMGPEDPEERKNKRIALLKSNPAGLQLEDRIRLAVFENPLADDTDIRKRLADSDFGGASVGRTELLSVLKKLGLETKVKRYNYFMHS